jgi:hypothetical protein
MLAERTRCASDGCRRRTTPASILFLGRKVFFGAAIVLICALAQGLDTKRVAALRKLLGVSWHTMRRWKKWWLEIFPLSRGFKSARGFLAVSFDIERLPASLLASFGDIETDTPKTIIKTLFFLARACWVGGSTAAFESQLSMAACDPQTL